MISTAASGAGWDGDVGLPEPLAGASRPTRTSRLPVDTSSPGTLPSSTRAVEQPPGRPRPAARRAGTTRWSRAAAAVRALASRTSPRSVVPQPSCRGSDRDAVARRPTARSGLRGAEARRPGRRRPATSDRRLAGSRTGRASRYRQSSVTGERVGGDHDERARRSTTAGRDQPGQDRERRQRGRPGGRPARARRPGRARRCRDSGLTRPERRPCRLTQVAVGHQADDPRRARRRARASRARRWSRAGIERVVERRVRAAEVGGPALGSPVAQVDRVVGQRCRPGRRARRAGRRAPPARRERQADARVGPPQRRRRCPDRVDGPRQCGDPRVRGPFEGVAHQLHRRPARRPPRPGPATSQRARDRRAGSCGRRRFGLVRPRRARPG